ncbi:MAG TPA: helix-turn-helix domain-containing protein, partial [Planctomycetota bacterium]|nr:helix-turn-helix domain-containing protein [Planctomycetota bacterium]
MADFYTFGEVLKVLQSNSQELNKWIETGELRPTIHEGDLKFRGSDVERILASKQRYNWNQVLNALQIETPELQNLINEGTFQVYNDNGKITFDRQEIDQYIALRQIDATIVMASDSDVSLVDDEYDDDFNFSTRRDSKPDYSLDPLMDNFRAANQSKDVYTLDGALSMLQMDEAELEAMIADGEVSVFHNAQGMPEFL